MKQIALITGATSGIGKASAEKFAQNGYDIIITGRREDRLKVLKEDLESKYNVQILALCFDVRKRAKVQDL